jgi:hypothetical protein
MNQTELRKLAIKELKTRDVQMIKKQVCQKFIDKHEKKECMSEFDKNFIKSFMDSYQKQKIRK